MSSNKSNSSEGKKKTKLNDSDQNHSEALSQKKPHDNLGGVETNQEQSSNNNFNSFEEDIAKLKNSYENVAYQNLVNVYPKTFVKNIEGLLKLFGTKLTTFEDKKMRVLEIGCAHGDNLIAQAFELQNIDFVGIDLATSAIEKGKRRIEELGLKNIELHAISFTELNKQRFESFDLIIAHGVYSWITSELQDLMFKSVSEMLNREGAFYVSYNVFPGWYIPKIISQYLKLSCGNMEDGVEKQNQVFQHLSLFNKSFANRNDAYAIAAREESKLLIEQMKRGQYSYVRHDHLSEGVNPIDFSTIVKTASKYQMSYATEVDINSLVVPESLPELKQITDIITQQSFLDYYRGTRFRSSIFRHSSAAPLNRNININSLKSVNFKCDIYSKNPITAKNILSEEELEFLIGNSPLINSKDRIAKACLAELAKLKLKSSNFDEIVSSIYEEYKFQKNLIEANLSDIITKMLIAGVIHPTTFNWDNKISDKPEISKIVKNQLDRNYPFITGRSLSGINVDPIAQCIYSNCNGHNTKEDLKAILFKAFEENKITASNQAGPLTMQEISDNLESWINQYLENARIGGLLV